MGSMRVVAMRTAPYIKYPFWLEPLLNGQRVVKYEWHPQAASMSPERLKLDEYYKRVAAKLRSSEANFCRGQPELLNRLDQTTDLDLMTKWAWKSAIIGAIFAFAGLPLFLMLVSSFLPTVLNEILWFILKLSMGLAGLMFGLAAYFTFYARKNID